MWIFTIAHDEIDGYESKGYILKCNFKKDQPITEETTFSIYGFSHCSCNDSKEGIFDTPYFKGNYNDFYEYIKNKTRVDFPDKKISKDDYDYELINTLYITISNWKQSGFPKGPMKRISTSYRTIYRLK
jgi:hypothetical protein